MPDLSKFKTAHQIAKELLACPDHIVIIPTGVFDMPGAFTAFPAKVEVSKVQNVDVVMIMAADPSEPEKSAEVAVPDTSITKEK